MRLVRPLLLLALAGLVGAVIGVVALRARDSGSAPAAGPTMTPRMSIAPRVHVFGDRVSAEVELLFDRRRVDPDTVRIDALFDPYEQVGGVTRVRSDAGDLVRLRFRYALACFTTACLPTNDKSEITLQTARVVYTLREARSRAIDPIQWPAFEVASRLGPFDVERARWRADLRSLPAVTYAVEPGLLAAGLGAGALLLVAAGLALAIRLAPRRHADDDDGVVERVPPLERALAAVVAASSNGSTPEQRKALERLARELGAIGHPALAGRARRLAWSARRAGRGDVDDLERDVRSVTGTEL